MVCFSVYNNKWSFGADLYQSNILRVSVQFWILLIPHKKYLDLQHLESNELNYRNQIHVAQLIKMRILEICHPEVRI